MHFILNNFVPEKFEDRAKRAHLISKKQENKASKAILTCVIVCSIIIMMILAKLPTYNKPMLSITHYPWGIILLLATHSLVTFEDSVCDFLDLGVTHSVYSILTYVINRCLPKRVPFPG